MPREQRREQLLDAALRIIDRDGYDGISIDAIARESGVTRPVVYGAYEGLGALLGTLLDRQQQRAVSQLDTALPFDSLPVDSLDSTLDALIEGAVPALHAMVLEDPMTWRAILTSGSGAPQVVQERIAHDRDQVRGTIETMIAGVAPAGTDATVLSHAMLAMLEHFGRLVLSDPEEFPAERFTRSIQALVTSWRR
ncbi:MAG: TetR/AcrR family transcriptional regulator [Nocardioidaceae bacterium]|nr:TetR/AcrR family transcriptional regulator [Nocardioidaceae bacterium]